MSFALSFAAFLRGEGFNFSEVRAGNVFGSPTAGVEGITLKVRGFAVAVLRELSFGGLSGLSETGYLAARGGSCGADGVLKPKADGVKMLKLFIARVVRSTIKSISWSGLTLTVKYTVCMISSCD